MMEPSPQPPKFHQIRWFGCTHPGKVRANNEDSFLCVEFDATEMRHLGRLGETSTASADAIFAVSDGMGGANAGEFASRVAVEKIARILPKSFKQSASGISAGFEDVLAQLYHEIHKALSYLSWGDPDCSGMGATLTLIWFTPKWLYFAHIGDSRLYYFPKDQTMKQLSHDDTHVGWLLRNKKITEWQARNHPAKNSLSKALGAGHQFVDPQLGAVGYASGDRFLLCTDGLIDGLNDAVLTEFSQISPNPAEALVKEAVERSGRDNTTALMIEVL